MLDLSPNNANQLLKIWRTDRSIRTPLSFAAKALFALGGLGLFVWYSNYASDARGKPYIVSVAEQQGWPEALFLTAATVSLPVAPLVLGGVISYLLSRLGSVRVVADGSSYVHNKLPAVPDADGWRNMWDLSKVISTDEDARALFEKHASLLQTVVADVKTRPSFREFVINEAASTRVILLRPDLAEPVLGKSETTCTPAEVEQSVGRDWMARTASGYAAAPDALWAAVGAREQEWVLQWGPQSSAIRWLLTTQRICFFERKQLVQSIDRDSVQECEVTF